MNSYSTAVAPFLLAVENKDVRQTMEQLRKMFDSMTREWKLQESPLYRRIAANEKTDATGSSLEMMLKPIVKELKESPEYKYLWESEEFRIWLAEVEEKIS